MIHAEKKFLCQEGKVMGGDKSSIMRVCHTKRQLGKGEKSLGCIKLTMVV